VPIDIRGGYTAEGAICGAALRVIADARRFARKLQRLPRLENPHRGAQVMRFESLDEPVDRVVSARGDVVERAPVVRHEYPAAEALEEGQRIVVREMASAKACPLPPRRISDGQKRDVELSAPRTERPVNEVMGVGRQCRVAGEEARFLAVIEQIHVRIAAPAIEAVSVPTVRRQCRMNVNASNPHRTTWRQILRVLVSTSAQPLRDYRWRV